MAGSNMFVLYTSSDGNNVTISPRLGAGYNMPEYTTSTNLELLDGSGFVNGIMTANVRCTNCGSWTGGSMDFSTSSATWIWATASGSSLDSDDLDASISMHGSASSFTFDLSQARGGSADVNPFGSSSGTRENTDSSTPSTPSASIAASNDSDGESGGSSSTSTLILVHGVMASLAFVGLFPIGSILIAVVNFSGVVWFHAALQILAIIICISAFGIGVYLATSFGILRSAHPIIGIVLLIVVILQPITGWLHHRLFRKYHHRTLWSYFHLWSGRTAILLGMVNGGLGLALARTGRSAVIAYGVFAGVIGVIYIAAAYLGERRRKQKAALPAQEKSQHRHGSSSEEAIGRSDGGREMRNRQYGRRL